jgi:PAS domain S-box-containing protein
MTQFINLQTFPHDDLTFRAHVEAAQVRIGQWLRPRIEAEIRVAYPAAVVHRSEALAQFDPDVATWYAYRDGHFEPSAADDEWWLDPDLARTVLSRDGTYLDANQAAADLFGVSCQGIVGARAGSFTRHEGGQEIERRLFALLDEVGTLHSTAVVVRPDGEEWQMEFHTTRLETADRFVTVMRRTPSEASPQV